MFNYFKYITILFSVCFCQNSAYSQGAIFQKDNFKIQKNINLNNKLGEKFNFYNSLEDDKKYIINFWATWCLPCKKELPELQKMQSENNYLNILLISIDKKEISEQLKFLKNNNVYKLKKYFDPNMLLFKSLKLKGIPTTLIVKQKVVIAKKEGKFNYSKKSLSEINSFN